MDNLHFLDDAVENLVPLTQPMSNSTSYLDNLIDISDNDFDIPCFQKRMSERYVIF